ncbi:MAG TPA: Hpt domain-containing protein [Pirellulales bacterium]|nr:Hpt domain-containing protein [Pirellulales bacterium]
MSQPNVIDGRLQSSLAEDADLGQVIARYVDEMPGRIETMLERAGAADFDALADMAHQLKGSAGSHGFHQLTGATAAVERAIRDRRPETEVRAALDALVALCRRVRQR